MLFVHGGNWNSGKKELYNLMGRHYARKGIIAVIPGYNVSPTVNYDIMTSQIAEAINWTHSHVAAYGGDTTALFLSGHSAGGHLAALATMNPKYKVNQNKVSGIVLNDAAGLDMHHYLMDHPPTQSSHYLTTWGTDPEVWKAASPIYFIDENNPAFMIYLGEKTYNSIKIANKRFLKALHTTQPMVKPIVLDKMHIPMVLQFFNPWSKRYKEIKAFMKDVSGSNNRYDLGNTKKQLNISK